jgi:hypothetical protein
MIYPLELESVVIGAGSDTDKPDKFIIDLDVKKESCRTCRPPLCFPCDFECVAFPVSVSLGYKSASLTSSSAASAMRLRSL